MSYAFFCFVPQQHVTKMARSLKLHFMSGRRKFWVKNSFDSRIICTQRWSPRQLTNNYNGEKNTGKRNRTTLMVVVRGTIHTFVSSHFLSSCEKLRKKNRTLYRRYANTHKCLLDINGWQKDKAKGDKIIYSKYSKRFKIVWIILILFTYSLNRQFVFA